MSTDEGKEFDLIRRLFAPLAANRAEALQLTDDAAVLSPATENDLAITTDCLVAGVHFRPEDPPETVAARALRSNLSDLAAMGAIPDCYTLAIALPSGTGETWLTEFASQLGRDQATFAIDLIGGDTVVTPGPLTVTITAIGRLMPGQGITRSMARIGDDVYVTGTIGDAGLGLAILNAGAGEPDKTDRDFLASRFHYPQPRTTLGSALPGTATAMADVSDGLIADLGHICEASGVGATIRLDLVPFSQAARNALEITETTATSLLCSGDDYELVFTAKPDSRARIEKIQAERGIPITRIGSITDTDDKHVTLLDADGNEVNPGNSGGYVHRW